MKDLNVYGMYLKEIKGVKYLSAEEEKELVRQAKKGDKRAKDRIIQSGLHYVIKIAKGFKPSRTLSMDDLIAYGNIGLLKAFDGYHEGEGTRFITYASFWIRKEISDAVKKYARTVRLPQNCEEDLSRIFSVMEELSEKLSESSKISEAAFRLGMKESYIRRLLDLSQTVQSLDDPFDDCDSGSGSVVDKISDDSVEGPDRYAEIEDLGGILTGMLDTLTPNERNVLVERTGYDCKGIRSLSKIGDELGMSKENVRTIERRALSKCRKLSESRNLDLEVYFAA